MDDISYLKQHGKEESYMFIVDSGRRDVAAYPNPNSYTIQFNAPFKNVTGLEMLDATVPRTEYTVENTMNSFAYSVDGGAVNTVSITPGDYNLLELSTEISSAMKFGLVCEPESAPYTRTSRTRFYCANPFVLDMSVSNSIRNVLGFSGTRKSFPSSYSGESTKIAFNGPFPGFQTTRANSTTTLRQAFVPSVSGRLTSIVVHATAGSSSIDVSVVDAEGTSYGSGSVSPGTSDEISIDGGGNLVAGTTYYVAMDSGGAEIYINEPPDAVTPVQFSIDNGESWEDIGEALAACVEVQVAVGRHEIVSPGLVDLTGERYVLIRCPDVETLMHRERAYEQYHAGLGMVKLGAMGYREQRFDFVSLPSVRITNPIGKVSSLTFRLEKSDGSLYDARGVNHVLVLKITYYANLIKGPMAKEENTQLNPKYTPQIHEYMEREVWSKEAQLQDTLHLWKK